MILNADAPTLDYDATPGGPLALPVIAEHGDPCPPSDLGREWCGPCDREHQPRERAVWCHACGYLTARTHCLRSDRTTPA